MDRRHVATDVLVIGGGMAGRASIEAGRHGARVAMVMKGTFGKSGTSAARVAEAAGYVESLLTVGEIMARCALLRTESRRSHYREDCPLRVDTRWETSIVTRRRGGRAEQYTQRLPRLSDRT